MFLILQAKKIPLHTRFLAFFSRENIFGSDIFIKMPRRSNFSACENLGLEEDHFLLE